MKANEFKKWFVAQFGPRPIPHGKDPDVKVKISNMEWELRRLKEKWKETQLWDDKHTAALYAWQARERTTEDDLSGKER